MKIIVVVDMQKDVIRGALKNAEAEAIIPRMQEVLTDMNSSDNIVLFTKDTHYDDYMNTQEGKYLPVPHCIKGTDGWKIDKRISSIVDKGNYRKVSAHSIINSRILKNTFGSLEVAETIKSLTIAHPIDEVIFMGVCTDICVVSNVILTKAVCPELLVTVYADCCAGVTPAAHKAALETMKSCQVNVIGE